VTGPNYISRVFRSICSANPYLPIAHTDPFRPNPSHSATDSKSARFNVNIFSLSAVAGGSKKFHPALTPAIGCPVILLCIFFSGCGGLEVSMLTSGTQDRGFKPGQSRRMLRTKNSSACLPSEGKLGRLPHVADLRHVKEPNNLLWKLQIIGYIVLACFHSSLTDP
jgi:hypothetical protein